MFMVNFDDIWNHSIKIYTHNIGKYLIFIFKFTLDEKYVVEAFLFRH